eukprot:scaffold8200_cov277-Pinguiococcus_pyrenoidosus.AAC.4
MIVGTIPIANAASAYVEERPPLQSLWQPGCAGMPQRGSNCLCRCAWRASPWHTEIRRLGNGGHLHRHNTKSFDFRAI